MTDANLLSFDILPQNKTILANFQKIADKFGLEKMSSDEQSIFMLEFARVARLRFEQALAKARSPQKNKDQLFLEEIDKLQMDLTKQQSL